MIFKGMQHTRKRRNYSIQIAVISASTPRLLANVIISFSIGNVCIGKTSKGRHSRGPEMQQINKNISTYERMSL